MSGATAYATERDAAAAIAAGAEKSPYFYENSWLYAIRITGTGISYRSGLKEYVFRDPAVFLAPEFVERCNGLPVILVHPDGAVLTAEEYYKRVVGSILLPYMVGDEVWGIARIFDADVVKAMQTGELSTSPGVRFSDLGELATLQIDEERVTVEGTPSLVDHIAVVPAGVWDKGGAPSGIRNDAMEKEGEKKYGDVKFADPENDKYPIDTEKHIRAAWDYIHKDEDADKYGADDLAAIKRRIVAAWKDKIDPAGPPEAAEKKDSAMADEKEGAPALDKRADAEKSLMDKLDAICAKMDSMATRMDGYETMLDKRADADEPKEEDSEDKKDKKDEDGEKKEEKERADAAAAENAALRALIEGMQSKLATLTATPTAEEMAALSRARTRADAVLQMHGERADNWHPGESSISYRKRMLPKMIRFSEKLKDLSVDALDGVVLDQIEHIAYADAQAAVRNPAMMRAGVLVPIVSEDSTGRKVTRYMGDSKVARDPFSARPITISISRPSAGGHN